MPLMHVVLMESLMRVITSRHATTWHMVIITLTVLTLPSFRAAMEPVSVREASYKHRDFLISVAHRLPLHHPPPRYVYFLMLSIYALRPIYQTLTIVSIFIFHPFSPPGALSRHLPHHHLPIRLRQHLPHYHQPIRLRRHLPRHHLRPTQVNNRP